MAHDVFISYSSKDKPVADAACATLEARGIRCWIAPRDIRPGSDWGESIVDAIHASKAFVLVFSQNANASVQIKREVERAINRGIPVIPLRIENVMPEKSLEYFLSTPHWLDAYSPPLEQHLNYLAQVIRSILDGQPAPQPGPGPVPVPVDRRLVMGGGAALLVVALGVGGWFLLGPSSHSFAGKWTAEKIQTNPDTPSPFAPFSVNVFLKAAESGNRLFSSFNVDDAGNYNYLWGGDDTGTVAPAGPGRMTFTSDLTHQATSFTYSLVPSAAAGPTIASLGGQGSDGGLLIQTMGLQAMLVGPGTGLTGHWITSTPASGAIDAVRTALDVTPDGHYHYHFEISESGLWQYANGKWTSTRPGAAPSSGSYTFDGGDRVTTINSGGVTVWKRAS